MKNIKIGKGNFALPYAKEIDTYFLLLPKDILEGLPIANSYDDIEEVVRDNQELRKILNNLSYNFV